MKLLHLSTVTLILFVSKVKAVSRQEVNCGTRLIHHRGLIANGFGVTEGDWPWHAAIYHIGKRFAIQYKCGGTLLNSNSILTAAHCIHENDQLIIAERILVNLGRISLINTGSYNQQFNAYNIIPHPNYGSDYSNDIAIIRLATEAKFNNYVQPICLWESTRLDISEVERRLGTVVGWGITENDTISYNLRQAFMPVQTHLTCLLSNRDFFGSFLSDKNFCAGFRNGTSVCQGDSGGSMVFEDNGVYRIRGIVSLVFQPGDLDRLCNSMDYVIFTDVAKYLTWIQEVVPQLPSPSLEVDTRHGGSSSNLLPVPLVCGRVLYNDGISGRTRIKEFPWMALMIYSDLNNVSTFRCTGVLISERYVLTSVMCTVQRYYDFTFIYGNISGVRLGEWNAYSDNDCDGGVCSDQPTDVPVEEIIKHPNWDDEHIALIRLSRSVTYTESVRERINYDCNSYVVTDFIQPICLPSSETLRNISYKDVDFDIVGWGIDENSIRGFTTKDKVREAATCISKYNDRSSDPGQFCTAGAEGIDLCRDEGSPLMTIDRSNPTKPYYYCAGISLSGRCDGGEVRILYVRISVFIDWILENIRV